MHWEIRDKLDAAAFALGAFAIPYLAAGLRRFAGYDWWWVLVWPKEAGSLWGPLEFELGGFVVVAVLVYWLRLRALGESTIWRDVAHGALKANAALTGGVVFLVLYLAVGVGLHGTGFGNVWGALTWPYQSRTLHVAVLVVLAAFAGVSLFAGGFKGRMCWRTSGNGGAMKPWQSHGRRRRQNHRRHRQANTKRSWPPCGTK